MLDTYPHTTVQPIAVLQIIAVFATVAGERVKINTERGADKYGWWAVTPLNGKAEDFYFCRRECMSDLHPHFKIVEVMQ